jgi:hypothetical protein
MSRLKSFAAIVMGLLYELSDESAYRRHLAAHGLSHSATEWRTFCEERLAAKYRRTKCC